MPELVGHDSQEDSSIQGGDTTPSVEAQTARAIAVAKTPSQRERDEHELTGCVQYRSWCWHCVASKLHGVPHRRLDKGDAYKDAEIAEIVMDYVYMGSDDTKVVPNVALKDRRSGAISATALEAKNSEYGVKHVSGFLTELGYKRLILKSDNEPAVLTLKSHVTRCLPEVEIVPKESVEGDPQSNGAAEANVREMKKHCRALKSSTEDRLGRRIPPEHHSLAWIPRFQACNVTRYRVLQDGRTAVERYTGRTWNRPALKFLERALFKPAVSQEGRKKNSYDAKFRVGWYLGSHSRSSSILFMTPDGVS